MRPGHIKGSHNVPYTEFTNEDGTFKSPDALRQVFAAHGVDPAKPSITTCGSGITAAIALLGLTLVNAKKAALYDGSWAEWGARLEVPVEIS